jgi:hypothetical protein
MSGPRVLCNYLQIYNGIQGDQEVSVHLTITIQKVTSDVQSDPANIQPFIDTRLTLTSSVIPDTKYVIIVRD